MESVVLATKRTLKVVDMAVVARLSRLVVRSRMSPSEKHCRNARRDGEMRSS